MICSFDMAGPLLLHLGVLSDGSETPADSGSPDIAEPPVAVGSPFGMVIVDESHNLKNLQTARTRRLLPLLRNTVRVRQQLLSLDSTLGAVQSCRASAGHSTQHGGRIWVACLHTTAAQAPATRVLFPQVVLLTGTPALSRPFELFPQADAVQPVLLTLRQPATVYAA